MPWVRAVLRGKTLYARADAAGGLAADGKGLVEVRYNKNDGRAYSARADNLVVSDPTPLPDDTCGPAEAAPPKPRAGAKGASVAKAPSASRSSSSSASGGAPAPPPPPADPASVIAYTDGACSGNPGPAGLGVVVVDAGVTTELSEYLGLTTNNVAELTAIARALDQVAARERPIQIHTDSQYAIGVLSKGWKAKANGELIAAIKAELARRPRVRLVYVPGHAGVPLNERADELARRAIINRGPRVGAGPARASAD
ncbi:MAG TPA: ribonuclease H [Polyangiaceae bacterium]|nr:ribonuclease H [Polyangiaceae bacterium]